MQHRDASASITPERRVTVERARQTWIRKLIDLSRRNNLLYYRPLKTGTLDLSLADATVMAALLSGTETVPLAKLIPNGKEESVKNQVREIARRAQANAEERGIQTLFLALGMATWPSSDGGRAADAPVLLLPLALEVKGARSFIKRIGPPQINLVLLHVLETQFGAKITSEELIPHLLGDDEGEPFDPIPLYSSICRAT